MYQTREMATFHPPRTRSECERITASYNERQYLIQMREVATDDRRALLLVGLVVLVVVFALLVGNAIASADTPAWYLQNMTN